MKASEPRSPRCPQKSSAHESHQTRRFAVEAAMDRAVTLTAIETLREAILNCQPIEQVAIRLFDLAKIEAFLAGWRC